jgi:hypothetical protein
MQQASAQFRQGSLMPPSAASNRRIDRQQSENATSWQKISLGESSAVARSGIKTLGETLLQLGGLAIYSCNEPWEDMRGIF